MADERYREYRGSSRRGDGGRDVRSNSPVGDEDRERFRDRAPSRRDHDERGFFDRARDEVRSWFDDDEGRHPHGRNYAQEDSDRGDARGRAGERGRADYAQEGSTGRSPAADPQRGYRARHGETSHARSHGGSSGGHYKGRVQSWAEANRGADWRGGGEEESGWTDRDHESHGTPGGRQQDLQDEHYRSWRKRQAEQLDRDYEDYCRERRQRFGSDFDSWRRERHGNSDAPAGGSNAEGRGAPDNGASGLIGSRGWDPSTPTGEPRSSESADEGRPAGSRDEQREAPGTT